MVVKLDHPNIQPNNNTTTVPLKAATPMVVDNSLHWVDLRDVSEVRTNPTNEPSDTEYK